MRFPSLFSHSFASLTRSRHAALRVTCLIAVPFLVALVTAWSLAATFDSQDRIPVAVVNLDAGYTTDSGVKVSAGQDVVDSLEDGEDLLWDFVDEDTAASGLEAGTYALVVKIPADYSRDVSSLSTGTPVKATIDIVSSGAENILATRAGSAALKQVQERIRRDLGENYLLSVLSSVHGQASTLTLTADGAVMLDEGYDALSEGADALGSGLDQVASAADALGEGTDQIAAGAGALGDGAQQVAQGLDTVNDHLVAPLATGAQALAAGLDTAGSTAQAMGASLVEIGSALTQLGQSVSVGNEDVAALAVLAPQLSRSAGSLSVSLEDTRTASSQLDDAAGRVLSAVDGAKDEVSALSVDASELACVLDNEAAEGSGEADGIKQQLAQIDAQIDAATAKVAQVADEMADGDAADRLSELKSQLDAAVTELTSLKDQREQVSQRLGEAAVSARELETSAGNVSSDLASAESARSELSGARTSYESASLQASSDAQQVSALTAQAMQPATSALVSLLTVQRALLGSGQPGDDTYAPGLGETVSQLGSGVSAIGVQLGSSGSIGVGAGGLATGTAALSSALSPMASAVSGIGSGASALRTALSATGAGASALGQGISSMASASSGISSGISQLKSASAQVGDVMSSAGETLSGISSESSARAKVAASPISFSSSSVHAQRSTVTSLAAPAVAAALWCAALAASLFLPAVDMRRVVRGRCVSAVLGSWLPSALVVLIQAGVLALACRALGVNGEGAFRAFAVMVPAALAIASIHQFLRICLDRLSGPVSVALLALQLVSAGAFLPGSLAQDALGPLSCLPVPQLSGALRRAFAALAPSSTYFVACGVVVVAALILSCFAAARKRTVRPERLQCA